MGKNVGLLVAGLTAAAVFAAPTTAEAAPKAGCPNDSSAWEPKTVTAAATTIYPELLPGQVGSVAELTDYIDGAYDKNADGSVCLKTYSDDERNPKSHFAEISVFYLRDNSSNGG